MKRKLVITAVFLLVTCGLSALIAGSGTDEQRRQAVPET